MIVDVHYHLEERMETVDELLLQMKQHNIDRVVLIPTMVDPIYLKGIAAKAGEMMPKALMSRWRSLGLLLYKTTVTRKGKFSALGTTFPIYEIPDNESVARTMQAHPDRFYGWIFVNPRVTDPLIELEKRANEPGWIGVKVHPFWHRYAVRMLDDVAGYCTERDWPLLMHLGGDEERGDYRYLPERHPGLKVLYAHAGVPFYREVWEYIKEKNNLFIDLSNPVYVDDGVRQGAIRALGAEKCLHGTDGPYASASQGRMLQKILRLALSEDEMRCILSSNFTQLIYR